MSVITDEKNIRDLLESSHNIAVLGAHPQTARAAFYVPDYLQRMGYEIYPVNGAKVGMTLWGKEVLGTLSELEPVIDIVDVFRRPDALPGHLQDILQMDPLPKVVWLQLGIRNDAFARSLAEAGITVVQDRCTLADHRRWGIAPKS